MRKRKHGMLVSSLALVLVGTLGTRSATAQAPATTPIPAGKPIEIRVTPVAAPAPAVSITLGSRHGHATPDRHGCNHTGGGNTDVSQPSADTVVITMTGVTVATGSPCSAGMASMDFDLTQELEIVFEKSDVKRAKVTLEARAIGLLRSEKSGGTAEICHAQATLSGAGAEIATICLEDHAVANGDNLSINDHQGPNSATIGAGKYCLCQTVHFMASRAKCILPCKAASAEFAPDPALDPLWISYWEPFHGASKKDFGFQVIIKVAPDTDPAPEPTKKPASTMRNSKNTVGILRGPG